MKTIRFRRAVKLLLCLLLLLRLSSPLSSLVAQPTAFTYQGRLNDGGGPANGSYDLTFSIWTNSSGPAQAGMTVTNLSTPVSNGLFAVTLDFGTGIFTGAERWLEIGARTNGSGPFVTLAPRQRLTSTPYAVAAANLTGVLSSGSVAGSYSNAVAFNNAANQFTGSFTGDGGGLSNVNAQTLGGWVPSSFWRLTGNNTGPGQFLGSTNDQPLELRANGMRALRLEPNTNGAPNVIGGSIVNQVDGGVIGAFIGGGGAVNYFGSTYSNRVAASFGAIGGGLGNLAQGTYSVISGGVLNDLEPGASGASITGGYSNLVRSNAVYSIIGGGIFNAIEISTPGSFIGGGWVNTNGSAYSVIGGGVQNMIQPEPFGGYSVIGGGDYNTIQTNAASSVIAGGNANLIQSGAFYSSIGGGNANTNGSAYSAIDGGNNNVIQSSSDTSFIGAGWQNLILSGADQCVIGGGNANHILSGARESFVGGGFVNTLQTNSAFSFIGAGTGNMVGTNSIWGTIAGGQDNSIQAGAAHATIGGGTANTNSGGGAFIGGGILNRADNFDAVVVGGGANVNAGYRAFIGSGQENVISNAASYSAMGGGLRNAILAQYGTVAGGNQNTSAWTSATVGGGFQNLASGNFNGFGDSATVAGGYQNSALGNNAVVGGGADNQARGDNSTIAGGALNTNQTGFGFIGGGNQNLIEPFSRFSTISGGDQNSVRSNSTHSVIAGGQFNIINTNAPFAVVVGGSSNEVKATFGLAAGRRAKANHPGSFVWADSTDADFASTASNQFAIRATGGVRLETASGSATLNGQPILSGVVPASSLAGVYPNPVTFANNQNVFIGNGTQLSNVNAAALGGMPASSFWQLGGNAGTVAGPQFLGTTDAQPLELHVSKARALRLEPNFGRGNVIGVNMIGGYMDNAVVSGLQSTIAGGGGPGVPNIISGQACTIGGGISNSIGNDANSIIAGGNYNSIGNSSSDVISGGWQNTISNCSYSMIPGGVLNKVSADFSLAAGFRANATNNGAFVWADAQPADFFSTSTNQFSVRANGGMRLNDDTSVFFGAATRQMLNLYASAYGIGVQSYRMYFRVDAPAGFAWFAGGSHTNATDNPGPGGTELMTLDSSGNLSVRGVVAQNVALTSDRAAKENFKPVDSEAILSKVAALPITRWSFKGDSPTQHIGPMAQDFSAAFGTGSDDKHIAVLDEAGVALAAIQGLNQKVDSENATLREELRRRDAENAELKQTVTELRKLLERLNEKFNGGL